MRRILLFASVVVGCGWSSANGAPKEILRPNGTPPEFALLRSSGGKFILSHVVARPVLETQRRVDAAGKPTPTPRRGVRIVSENRTIEVPVEDFDVYTLAGEKYPKSSIPNLVKWLAERKKPWRALVSQDGRPVDPFYRQFASEGTLVLVRVRHSRSATVRAALPKAAEKPVKRNKPAAKSTKQMKTSRVPAKSLKTDKRVDVVFRNSAKQPVRVYWVDYEGREKDFGILEVGEATVECSNSQCVWRFKIYGEIVTSCVTEDKRKQTFEIHPPKYVLTRYEASVLELINVIRRNNGLPTLRHDRRLSAASRDHSGYMSRTGSFSHTSGVPGKYSFTDRAAAFGTGAISENIAWDGGGPKSVVNMWMNSPGHQANILDPSARTIGIGHSGVYWTQMFGSRLRSE